MAVGPGAGGSAVKVDPQTALVRRERLALLVAGFKSQAAFAREIERDAFKVNALLRGRANIGDRLAREIEQRLGKPAGWLDGE